MAVFLIWFGKMFHSQYNSSSTVLMHSSAWKHNTNPQLSTHCAVESVGEKSAVRKAHLQPVTKQMLWWRREEKKEAIFRKSLNHHLP